MSWSAGEAIVLDTDVASFIFNRDPIRGARYEKYTAGKALILPFAVVGELLYGARKRNWGAARSLRLERYIRRHFIEYPTYAVCENWADVRAACHKAGRPVSSEDAWVAATALYLQLPVLTHNERHFRPMPGLSIISEPDLR